MLVLTRKQSQEILIGDNIKLTVLKIKGNTVRLGIEAPRDINVVRGELPRQDSLSETAADPATENAADFTVVFSNTDTDPGAKVDVIPFESSLTQESKASENLSSRQRHSSQLQTNDSDSTNSVQFRGVLPNGFQHNRLKEIVNQLTSKSDGSAR